MFVCMLHVRERARICVCVCFFFVCLRLRLRSSHPASFCPRTYPRTNQPLQSILSLGEQQRLAFARLLLGMQNEP